MRERKKKNSKYKELVNGERYRRDEKKWGKDMKELIEEMNEVNGRNERMKWKK